MTKSISNHDVNDSNFERHALSSKEGSPVNSISLDDGWSDAEEQLVLANLLEAHQQHIAPG